MALFKISKGKSDRLIDQQIVEGHAWFTPDDGKFYIDADLDGTMTRIPLSSDKADRDSEGRKIKDTYSTFYFMIQEDNEGQLQLSNKDKTIFYTPEEIIVEIKKAYELDRTIICMFNSPLHTNSISYPLELSTYQDTEGDIIFAFSKGFAFESADPYILTVLCKNNQWTVIKSSLKNDLAYIKNVDGVGTGLTTLEKLKASEENGLLVDENGLTLTHSALPLNASVQEGKWAFSLDNNIFTLAKQNDKIIIDGIAEPTSDYGVANKKYVDESFRKNDAMLFKGIINSANELPDEHDAGWTYKVGTKGSYVGQWCEPGDTIYCIADGTVANNADWQVLENNNENVVVRGNDGAVGSLRVPVFVNDTGIVTPCEVSFDDYLPTTTKVVLYGEKQNLGVTEKEQALNNIGAVGGSSTLSTDGTRESITIGGLGTGLDLKIDIDVDNNAILFGKDIGTLHIGPDVFVQEDGNISNNGGLEFTNSNYIFYHRDPAKILEGKELVNKAYVDAAIAGGGGVATRYTVTVKTAGTEVLFGHKFTDTTKIMVYQNGVLLTPNVNYIVKNDGTGIDFVDYTTTVGDIFTFIASEQSSAPAVAVAQRYTKNITSETSDIPFNKIIDNTQALAVYQNGLLLTLGTHYYINSSSNGIKLIDYKAEAGDIFTFVYGEEQSFAQTTNQILRGRAVATEGAATIDIPFTIGSAASLAVYENGVLIEEGEQYSVTDTKITLQGYTASAGDVYTFVSNNALAPLDLTQYANSIKLNSSSFSGITNVQSALENLKTTVNSLNISMNNLSSSTVKLNSSKFSGITTAQAALENLQDNKLSLSGGTLTGALTVNNTLTASNFKMSNSNNTSSLSYIIGTTSDTSNFAKITKANFLTMFSGTSVSTSSGTRALRNIMFKTTEPTSSEGTNGDICIVYTA